MRVGVPLLLDTLDVGVAVVAMLFAGEYVALRPAPPLKPPWNWPFWKLWPFW